MPEVSLAATLLDDVVVSASSATAGGHRSLDYLPGALFMGAAARRLYSWALAEGWAFDAFHGGRVGFGDGYPVHANGRPTLRTPLSLHYPKMRDGRPCKPEVKGRLDVEVVTNLARTAADDDQQWEQVRTGYLDPELAIVRPETTFAMKTAISRRTGRPNDAQLFGYEALAAGSRFVVTLEGDDADRLVRIADALSAEPVRLGRSRSAEYGRVRLRRLEQAWAPWQTAGPRADARTTRLWFLSDAWLARDGEPILAPSGEDVGLPGWRVCWDRSFLRHRRFAPFNGKWRRFGLERHVVQAGSVLTLVCEDGDAEAAAPGWVGLGHEHGLGRLWQDPPILAEVSIKRDAPLWKAPTIEPEAPAAPAQETDLIRWLHDRRLAQSSDREAQRDGERLAQAVLQLYANAARLQGLSTEDDVGPAASQWNGIAAAARRSRSKAEIDRELFDPAKGLARANDRLWGETRFGPGENDTFHAWLRRTVKELDEQRAPRAIETMARTVVGQRRVARP